MSIFRMQRRVLAGLLLTVLPLISLAQSFPFGPKPPRRPDTVLIIHAGMLLAHPGEPAVRKQSIVVRNDIVDEIRDGYISPEEIDTGTAQLQILELRDLFVLPGLFDAHVHLSRATGAYQRGLPSINSLPAVGQATLNAAVAARLTLAAGFTAVRDLGSDQESVFALRDAINGGYLFGPTILASGTAISVTAGHGDDATSSAPDERARAGVCDGPDECRTLTRYLEKTGSDLIKFKASGGFSSSTGLLQHMTKDEMTAIVAAAHMRGIKVTAHAYAADAVLTAVKAGVDSVEHGFLASDKGLKLMRQKGVFLVPTVSIAEPPAIAKRFLRGKQPSSVTLRNSARAFERAYAQGVKIAFGTDAGIYPHGRNADELLRMVELGMSETDAIRAATVAAAELFALPGLSGTIEAGSQADIIAVAANPLEDIAALQDVPWVIKSGRVVKDDGTMSPMLDYSLPQRY